MNGFILILFLYAGPMSQADSVALTSIPGFQSLAACQKAGQQTSALVSGTVKARKFVCVKAE
jgi:hypothetical protein